jgi:hypothetical protein
MIQALYGGTSQTVPSNKLNSREISNSYNQKERAETLIAMCRSAERAQ